MNELLKIILIALIAMPQSWCCVVQGCDSDCDVVETAMQLAPKGCICCERALPADACASPEKAAPKSVPRPCECSCRFQISFAHAPAIYGVGSPAGLVEYVSSDLLCGITPVPTTAPPLLLIRLQVLYCSWQC
jgi:hypothetical protein